MRPERADEPAKRAQARDSEDPENGNQNDYGAGNLQEAVQCPLIH